MMTKWNKIKMKNIKWNKVQRLGMKNRSKKKISHSAKKDFYYMIYFFLQSKLPLMDALELLEGERVSYDTQEIKTTIQNGGRLMTGLQEAGLTDGFIDSCLLIGENRGSYEEVFVNIIDYLDQKIEDRNYLYKIISYPLILLILLLFVTVFIIFFLAPSLYTTFASMDMVIPLSLEIFYKIYQGFVRYRFLLLIIASGILSLAVSGVFHRQIKEKLTRRVVENSLVIRYMQPFVVRSLLWELHILTSAGIGINAAIEIIKENKNFIYHRILADSQMKIAQGFSLSSAWQSDESFFSPAVIKYIKIGESTGHFQENLKSAVEYMEIRCKNISEKIKQTMQPALVLIAGLGITLLLILVLPIINSATSFGGI